MTLPDGTMQHVQESFEDDACYILLAFTMPGVQAKYNQHRQIYRQQR